MAVGHVASATSGSQASVASFNIGTLGTGARCGVVFVATHNSSADIITGVTWNGVSMTRLYRAVDTDTEPGSVVVYFLDNVTNGTITVSRTNNATVTVGYAASASTASLPAYVARVITRVSSTQNTNADTSTTGTGASGEVAVDDGSPGSSSLRYAAYYSGAATPPAQGTNSTALQVLDSTALGSRFVRETTAGQGSRNVGAATGTTDDWALVAVAIAEASPRTIGALAFLDASPTVYALTATQPAASQDVTLGFLDAAATVYAPTLTPKNTLTVGLIDGGAAVYAPDVVPDQPISLDLLDTSATVYTPTLTPKNLIGLPLSSGVDYAAAVLADTPAGYWRLGEASGNPQDSSGNANHVTSVGGTPTYDVAGALVSGDDGAVRFTGAQGFNVPDHNTLDLGDTFSLEAWVKRNGGDDFQFIVSKSTTSYGLQTRFGLLAVRAGGSVVGLSTNPVPATGWHHVVATKDGAGSGQFHLYIDGVEDTDTGSYVAGTGTDSTSVLTIGAEAGAGQEYWTGDIDEVAVYDHVLTAAQIEAHYNAGLGSGGAEVYALTAAPAPYPIALGLIDGSATVYTPTVLPQPVTVGALDLIDAGATTYALSVHPDQFVGALALIDSVAETFAPTVVAGPATLTLDLVDSSPTVYAPTVLPQAVTVGALDLIDSAPAVYAPTVLPQPVTVGALDLVDAAAATYAPTILPQAVTAGPLGLIDSANAVYTLLVAPAQTLALSLTDNEAAVYSLTILPQPVTATLPLVDAASELYDPTLTAVYSVSLGLLDAGAAVYNLTLVAGSVTLGPLDLLDGGASTYAPSLSQGTPTQTAELVLLDSGAATYEPNVVAASSSVSLGLIDGESVAYALTVLPGPIGAELELLDAGALTFAPSLFPSLLVDLGPVDGAPETYALTLEQLAAVLSLPLIDGTGEVHALLISLDYEPIPPGSYAVVQLVPPGTAILAVRKGTAEVVRRQQASGTVELRPQPSAEVTLE